MSNNTTKNMVDERSFEERVFARFDSMDARFDSLDIRLSAVESRLDAVESRLDAVESRLQKLEDESERRSLETKPIWERALAEIAELRDEIREGFREISRMFGVVGHDMIQLRANQTHLETRLGKLESGFQR